MRTGRVKSRPDEEALEWFVASILTDNILGETVALSVNIIASDLSEAMLLANKTLEPEELLVKIARKGSYRDYVREVWPNGEG